MSYSFDIQDKVFEVFSNDEELLGLFQNPTTLDELNQRFQREITPLELITVERVPFMSLHFEGAVGSANMYYNKGYLTLELYMPTRYLAAKILKRIRELMEENFNLLCTNEYTENSGVVGIFYYVLKYRPLIWS